MNTSILSKLSLLSGAISKPLSLQVSAVIDSVYPEGYETKKIQIFNIYAAFLYSQDLTKFNGIEIFSNKDKFQSHLDMLIGFIYAEQEGLKFKTITTFSKPIHNVMCTLAKVNNIDIPTRTFGITKISHYIQDCISKYQSLPVNDDKLAYLNGWLITSQERRNVVVQLDFLYVKYGRYFTDKIHDALRIYGLGQKTNTLQSRIFELVNLLEVVSILDKKGTIESFELLLDENNVQVTFYKVFQIKLSECIFKNNNLVAFNRAFITSIEAYESAFINRRVYPSPLKPFIRPKVLQVQNPPSFSSGGKASELEKVRWFADIPLQIKDEEAIEIIEARNNRDMGYLKTVLVSHFHDIKRRQERNKAFIENGRVKPITGNVGGRGAIAHPIGSVHLENTVATFYHYGIGGYKGTDYDVFLGFRSKTYELIKELNLPTNSTLFTLTALLVIEHPKITPAWLQKLQLFNEYGKRQGYFQVGEKFILSSEKERRGRNLAQQDVVLNDFSKLIVDFIVEHTELAREHLKSIGNPNWMYLLLTCSHNQAFRPQTSAALYQKKPFFIRLLKEKANIAYEHGLSDQDVDSIASVITHRAIRRHRGLQIYLETRSLSAVADALGHKEAQRQLLESYLPKPLMDFFTERVVRQFQKAITLKAMEKSPYLLDAVNMSYEQIKEFMDNHGLSQIPDLNVDSFDKVVSTAEKSLFDNIVFTITVPLIQLLISIRAIIEIDGDESKFHDLVEHWYQSASYILKRFEIGDFSDSDEIQDMYNKAKGLPLNHDIIKEAISC
ncbi:MULTISPECIES: hypothetical protein [unclassified Vibrio]|uniref:hypothetical protein n=1 Tax=unclassified Vibrio TaxID=2614977 RepID=UPI003550A455